MLIKIINITFFQVFLGIARHIHSISSLLLKKISDWRNIPHLAGTMELAYPTSSVSILNLIADFFLDLQLNRLDSGQLPLQTSASEKQRFSPFYEKVITPTLLLVTEANDAKSLAKNKR